jgi:tetraacyldisaccharide 4'-kinase
MKIYNRESTAEMLFRGKGWYTVLLPLRIILSFIYRFITSLRTELMKKCRDRKKVQPKVISVGNIIVGGGGKTPCAITLAKKLMADNYRPVVLTRGYGGRAEMAGKPVILAAGMKISSDPGKGFLTEEDFSAGLTPGREFAETFGDEVAIYISRGIPVVIDPDRKRGAGAASKLINPTHIILDDGFQNFSVEKDCDILLLDHKDPFSGGRVLPWGRLREKPEAVDRADVVIFTRSRSKDIPEAAEKQLTGREIFFSRHEYAGIRSREEEEITPGLLKNRRIAVYSGIAVPESFERLIKDQIAEPEISFRFSDHHLYTEEDIEYMLNKAGRDAAFLTTEKDWFKSAGLFPGGVNIYRVRISMEIEDISRLMGILSFY